MLLPRGSPGVAALLTLARRYMSGVRLVEDVGREAVISFPHAAAEGGSLPSFLAELDRRLSELGCTSYGLADATLEEVSAPPAHRSAKALSDLGE